MRDLARAAAEIDFPSRGAAMHALASELYPICRSITGDGVRETLRRLGDGVGLEMHEVATGTQVFDWSIPQEWNIRDAWVKDPQGRKVIDFTESNLHVLNYSVPVHTTLPLDELRPHLYTLPDHPTWTPYKTSYYNENWGFCLPQQQLDSLVDGVYEVCIDSSLEPGHLSYGEVFLPGREPEEILLSCHVCHPSLANDNLSGMTLLRQTAEILGSVDRRYSYRLVFVPGTIGTIAWLARNRDCLDRIRHGMVVAGGVGTPGAFTYKKTRSGSELDWIVARVFRESGLEHKIFEFSPAGYDERQYGSPGVDLPMGRFFRPPYGSNPEYHTSADDLDFIRPEALAESLETFIAILIELEGAVYYENQRPHGEPQLGRRGLYSALGGHKDSVERETAMLWVLNLSDGSHSLAAIAERAQLPLELLQGVATTLVEHELLRPLQGFRPAVAAG